MQDQKTDLIQVKHENQEPNKAKQTELHSQKYQAQ